MNLEGALHSYERLVDQAKRDLREKSERISQISDENEHLQRAKLDQIEAKVRLQAELDETQGRKYEHCTGVHLAC